ncbi:mitogen-activated protein kinase kinase kinase 7 [Phoenix dactylifera]|uniref:Mitogen-activated protein kinase kinase kinase 7 n=1 Tax=Phoenix dactylifera TaxID=42345 RepID=A0A8B7C497_PHODC|nr:mitogen-activated protein kinase kinase kinase 7 [Phoenix dactylifera]
MEQFRQIGEVLGSLKALMVFREEIRMNQRQCCLLVDAFNAAFEGIADEIRHHLKFEEKLTKWKGLEQPFKELHRIFREGEQYIKQCLEPKDWWGKAIALSQSTDCVEFHLHNLLWCIPVVLEAIENVGEMTGCDQEEIHQKRIVFSKKYEKEWVEPKLFQHKFGKLYLVSQDVCSRMDGAWKEDRWILSEMIAEKRSAGSRPMAKQENRLAELLMGPKGKLFAASILVGSQDYQVKRRFGSSNYKEVQWMGESFAVKHVIGEIEPLMNEISLLSSINHPNVMHYMYSFYDEEKKEAFLVTDLMSKDLSSHIKEICSSRRRIPFPLLVAVDIMLQIARGMEYLHSRKIYHGDLNLSNVLVRARNSSPDGYLHVKIAGFGLSPLKNSKASGNQAAAMNSCIWYAPEVLLEQEQSGDAGGSKYTEKADVYSFAMICFEVLTGKVPFEDNHLQGDKMSKNIRAGERPLFPFQSPKYLTNLTKRCWHADPSQRPSFSSLCRVLRYVKRFLILNPDHGQPDSVVVPPVDYFDIDTSLSKRFTNWARKETIQVSEIPFQMYAYRVVDREKTSANVKDKSSESGSEEASICGDENAFGTVLTEHVLSTNMVSVRSLPQVTPDSNKKTSARKVNGKAIKQTGQHQKGRTLKPPQQNCGRSLRMNSESQLPTVAMSRRRRMSGHVSD